jgi:hypothetical protein
VSVYTVEQLEVLMMVAEAQEPAHTALAMHRRWTYILRVAEGYCADAALPQVVRERDAYAHRARLILAALNEWLAERLSDAS